MTLLETAGSKKKPRMSATCGVELLYRGRDQAPCFTFHGKILPAGRRQRMPRERATGAKSPVETLLTVLMYLIRNIGALLTSELDGFFQRSSFYTLPQGMSTPCSPMGAVQFFAARR